MGQLESQHGPSLPGAEAIGHVHGVGLEALGTRAGRRGRYCDVEAGDLPGRRPGRLVVQDIAAAVAEGELSSLRQGTRWKPSTCPFTPSRPAASRAAPPRNTASASRYQARPGRTVRGDVTGVAVRGGDDAPPGCRCAGPVEEPDKSEIYLACVGPELR
jgi:hypothetical protein